MYRPLRSNDFSDADLDHLFKVLGDLKPNEAKYDRMSKETETIIQAFSTVRATIAIELYHREQDAKRSATV